MFVLDSKSACRLSPLNPPELGALSCASNTFSLTVYPPASLINLSSPAFGVPGAGILPSYCLSFSQSGPAPENRDAAVGLRNTHSLNGEKRIFCNRGPALELEVPNHSV